MDNHFEHCSAYVTSLEQEGFLVKIHAQIPSDSGVGCRELSSRIDQISGHLRRVKCCESISRGQLAFARIEDNFHRVRALADDVEGRVAVKFIDYGYEDLLLLSDIIVVDPPLSDVLTTVRPLAEDFYVDGILLLRPLTNEEIVVLSEKILYQTVACRLRRLHPELSLIELAASTADRRATMFSNIVIELGFGKKCSSEDIAKYLRIKIPARADDNLAMQSGRPFVNNPYCVPPPTMLGSQATTVLGSPPTSILGSQATTMLGTHPGMPQISNTSSVNSRLSRFKKDAALNISGSGTLYGQASSPPPQLADRKQYAVTDGRTCTTAPTLPVKSTHNAYISHVEDGPFNFTIQLKSSVEDLLPKLRNILVRYQNSPITAQLIPGSVVMAKSNDETLRRGVIMNVQPETCKVYYIDFGNFEELPYSDIFQLPNTAAELSPAMAMQFCLSDLKSMKITDSNKDYFARLLLGKQVLIRVTERESNSPFQYCEIMWEGRSVREILLNLNSPMQYAYQYPPRGREAAVSVIYVDGPSQFFVQYRSELNVVTQIQEALASYCPSQPRVTDLSAINIGSPVASMFPDDQSWYRALVMGMDSTCVNVFYVDYGNRAEVTPNQICLLSRDLVNKWKTQAIECCLIGFDTVTPDLYMAEKMEEAALGRSYTLRLHSILSGFRLSVDLLDEQGNSVATNMKNLLNERQKAIAPPTTQSEKKKPQTFHDDDKSSQHSSDSGGHKNKYQRPATRGDRGNKVDQRGERKFDDRNKFEERQNSYSQHDDRSGNDYKSRNDSRSDWKKGVKKPYMDQVNEWDNSNQDSKPFKNSWSEKQDLGGGGFKKQEWKNDDKVGWSGGDSSNRGSRPDRGDRQGGGFRSDGDRQGGGFRSDGDRQGGGFRSDGDRKVGSNRFDRKPFNNDEDGRDGEREDSWRSRDRKFGERDNKFGDRDNKFGDRSGRDKFGDRDNKFGDRDNRFGSRENKFGDRDNKFGNRDKPYNRDSRKPQWNADDAVQRAPVAEETWEDGDAQAPVKRPSVVISEYPHQEIKVGGEYKVLFAGMDTSIRDVYVQLSDCDPELDKIRHMIDADATATSRPCSKPVLAMPVLARFNDDGLLYRATIKSISKVPTGQVDVLFVDFGNKAVNALSEVFTISSELMTIPIQAIHVIVTDMPSIPSANLEACQAHFDVEHLTLKPSRTTTVNLEQVVEGVLIRPDGQSVADCVKDDPSCHGEVQMVVETDSKLTSSVLLESQAQQTLEVQSCVPESIVLWRERLDLLINQRLLAKVVKKCADDNVYLIKITAVLDLIVSAQSVGTLSSELAQGADVIVAVNGLAKDRLLVNYYNRQGQSLGNEDAIGSIAPMQIVQRKGIFTISHRESSTLYLQHENSTTLSNLLERLFEKYEGSDFDTNEFKVGDLCAAKSYDGNWYRAKISTVVQNLYTVHYLDYGNSEDILVENLRKLDDEFMNPEMCVSVVLPVTYKDMECVEMLGEGPFECTFIEFDSLNGVWIVDLCTIGELNENLALKWIEAGKAESMGDVPADPKRREPGWNLKKGDIVPVEISHFDLPDVFYAHHVEQSNDLQALQDKLQDLPEGGDLGEFFVAKYTEDSMWYRAVRVGDKVRFLDYGNSDLSVETKSLPATLIQPAKGYAMPLRLCVSSVLWAEPAAQLFDDFIDKSGLEAEIISADFETIVDLRVGAESLAAIFVDKGFAVPFNTPLNDVLVDCVLEDELPVGKVPAIVTSMTNINNFYVQEMSKTDVLDLLVSRLEAADSYEAIEKPSLGQYLLAKFIEDSNWYRAKVINQDPIEVLFLDYGNVSPATEFRVLPLNLAAFPSLAWHCSVNVGDTPATNDHFTSLVNADAVFDVHFEEKIDDLHVVQLYVDNKNQFEVSDVLENIKTDIPSSTVERSDEVQVKPIPPALNKPFYKDCVLCHSNGPYDFYVQTDDDHIQIDEMANSLFEAGTFPKVDLVKKGDFVVAQFTEDDAYYRAIVTDVEPEVVVHFIDYGNSCPASCFHELPSALKKIPQLAVRCSLQSPIGGWSVDAIDKFTSLLNSETKCINLKIISRGDPTTVDVEINGSSITKQLASDAEFEPHSVHEALSPVNGEPLTIVNKEPPHPVDDEPHLQSSGLCYIASATPKECYIHDSSSSADLDFVTEQLASVDFSNPDCELNDVQVGDLVVACHDGALYRARITKLDPREVYFVDYGNESPVDVFLKLPDPIKNKKPLAIKVKLDLGDGVELNDVGVVELQDLAVDGANYTQTKPSVVELTIKGSKVTDLLKSHLVISDSNIDSSEPNNSCIAPATADTVEEAETIPVTISHVNSPSDFYYQLDLTKVNEMSSRLSEAEGFLPIEKCEVGQVICGKYSEDGLWYRAKILTTEPSLNVMFLDYGNISEVKEIKQLPDDLAKIPALCVKASLKTQDHKWTEEDASKFMEIAYGDANFTCSVFKNSADDVVVRLNSSEIGDVTTYLSRSCSVITSESEYGTPDVLSVDGIIPPDNNDESAVVDSFSFSLVDQRMPSIINVALDKETTPQPIDHFAEHSQVQSDIIVESKIENVLSSETESVSPSKTGSKNPEPSSVIHVEDDYKKQIIGCAADDLASVSSVQNNDELGSTDLLTVLARGDQASPTKTTAAPSENAVIDDSTDVAMDKDGSIRIEDMSDNVMDRLVASSNEAESLTLALTSPVTGSNARDNIGIEESLRFVKQSPNDTIGPQNKQLAECQDVDSNQPDSMSKALMIMPAEATPMPFWAGNSENVANPISTVLDQTSELALPSTASPSIVAPIDDTSSSMVEKPRTVHTSPTKSDAPVPLASDETQMYFRLPNLKETLFSVIGYDESSLAIKRCANIPSETGEENDPAEVMNSSTEVQASTSFNQLAENNESCASLNDESYFSNLSVSSLSPALVETIEEPSTKNFSSGVSGFLLGQQQSASSSSIVLLKNTIDPVNIVPSDGKPIVDVATSGVEQGVSPDRMIGSSYVALEDSNIDDLSTEKLLVTRPSPSSIACLKEDGNSVVATKNEENITVVKSEDLKTELDVTSSLVVKEVFHANSDGLEKSAVSEEHDVCVEPASKVPALTPIEGEANITVPSLLPEDLETMGGTSSVVLVDPLVSENITTLGNPEGVNVSIVSEEREIAIVRTVSNNPVRNTTKDEENSPTPSHLIQESEELDFTSCMVVGDPVVSGNIMICTNPDGREKYECVSEERDVACAELVSSGLTATKTEVSTGFKTELGVTSSLVVVDPLDPECREVAIVSEECKIASVAAVSDNPVFSTTKNDKNSTVPPHLIDQSEELKTGLDVNISLVAGDPVVSGNIIMSCASTDGLEKSAVSEERDVACVESVSSGLAPTTPEVDENHLASLVKPSTGHTTTKDGGNSEVPSDLAEKCEDLKTEMDIVCPIPIVEPVVSGNSNTRANTKDGKVTTASREHKANVKPTSKMSSTVTEPSKRIPVKTLAQIKASAKPRISTGRPSSNLKNKPSSQSGSPSPGRKLLASPATSSKSPHSKEDRIIPGTVNGSEI